MKIKVFIQKEQDKEFYSQMGPYFASLEIKKEMEMQLYNKDNSTWFIAYDVDEIIGFCSLFEDKRKIIFDNFYVLPGHRDEGIGSKLFKFRFDYTIKNYDKRIAVISKTLQSIHLYKKYGFKYIGNRGRYERYSYEREVKNNDK